MSKEIGCEQCSGENDQAGWKGGYSDDGYIGYTSCWNCNPGGLVGMKTPPKTSLNNQTLEAEIDELVEGIDADWWHDGQVPYELGVVAQSNTHKAIQSLITRECEKKLEKFTTALVGERCKTKDIDDFSINN